MDELEKLRSSRDRLVAEQAAVEGKITAILSADAISDEQLAEAERLEADSKTLAKKIAAQNKAIDRQAEALRERELADAADDRANRLRPPAAQRRTQPDQPGRAAATVADLEAVPDQRRGFRNPRDFILSVMSAGRGLRVDDRLAPLRQATAGSDEARGISDPAGGFLVPEAFSPMLLRVEPEDDPIGGLTTKIPMGLPILKIPARTDKDHTSSVSGGLTVTRRPETVAGTSSLMTMERCVLEAHELFGLSYASEEILTDSPQSFAAILEAGFSDQFVYHLINERLNGTGVGEYLGVMNSPALVSVAKETGQAAATIVKENIDKMRSRCWRYGRAIWLYNHDCLPQLKSLVQVVGVGGAPVPYFQVDAQGRSTLDGRPAFATEYTKTLGTAGDIVLCNWGEYLEGVYQPLQSAESIHVRFVNHERAFKFWVRNAGVPWWRTALTPKNSTQTLSPFVALATRS